ncbi:pyridoxamine 5'-phosphate oxidase family protein [Maribacter aestuarii]|uniref:pyridoxamine 5'-phosphate oxidase family protein n=1 Tax=Maribacter aestuarii TaxID=1130723 RepID=UPI0025A602B3|nr:pyridoxamine 5'-phosphate oxidase family protein [Maribacter aestuarii]
MTEVFFQELKEELSKSIVKKGHPFRYFTLATVGLDNMARLRTVVLRRISEDLTLTFYTDKRSKKMIHLKENKKISALFYHPKKLLQIKVEGTASVITDPALLKKYWHGIQPSSRKDYITSNAPGSTIKNPDLVEYLSDEDYFCMVEITPHKIEYLKLKRPNHIRVRYSRSDEDWLGEFLVP